MKSTITSLFISFILFFSLVPSIGQTSGTSSNFFYKIQAENAIFTEESTENSIQKDFFASGNFYLNITQPSTNIYTYFDLRQESGEYILWTRKRTNSDWHSESSKIQLFTGRNYLYFNDVAKYDTLLITDNENYDDNLIYEKLPMEKLPLYTNKFEVVNLDEIKLSWRPVTTGGTFAVANDPCTYSGGEPVEDVLEYFIEVGSIPQTYERTYYAGTDTVGRVFSIDYNQTNYFIVYGIWPNGDSSGNSCELQYIGKLPDLQFETIPGTYTNQIKVIINFNTNFNQDIYYTLDGSDPYYTSQKYVDGITLDVSQGSNFTIRAQSAPTNHSYSINEGDIVTNQVYASNILEGNFEIVPDVEITPPTNINFVTYSGIEYTTSENEIYVTWNRIEDNNVYEIKKVWVDPTPNFEYPSQIVTNLFGTFTRDRVGHFIFKIRPTNGDWTSSLDGSVYFSGNNTNVGWRLYWKLPPPPVIIIE